jgi:hypothetical protein
MRNPRLLRLISVLLCVALPWRPFAPMTLRPRKRTKTTTPISPRPSVNPKFPAMTGTADPTFKFEVSSTYRSARHGQGFRSRGDRPSGG